MTDEKVVVNDNPRDLPTELEELQKLLRQVFHRGIEDFVIRWENWTVATIEKNDPLEIAEALGTAKGVVLAWGEIVTPPQAKRLGKLTHALDKALQKHRGSGKGRT